MKTKTTCLFLSAIIYLICGCNQQKYPSEPCRIGQKSYQQGPLSAWQEDLRPWLAEQLEMSEELAQTKKQPAPAFRLVEKKPKTLHNNTRLYHVAYPSFDGRELFGFLVLPPEDTNSLAGPIQERPTLMVLHGHGRTKEDVVFDRRGTFKNVATKAAAQGVVVFVPDQRTFGENEEEKKHRTWVKKRPQRGEFMKNQVLDVMVAERVVEALDLGLFGLSGSISTEDNRVLGLSLGGYVALFAGAIDTDLEVVSVQSHFFPFEFLFTSHHCACQHIPVLTGQINITDLAMMIPPRKLTIGLGLRDAYVNGYVSSALDVLAKQVAAAGMTICQECPIALTVDKKAGHEVVSDDVVTTTPASETHH